MHFMHKESKLANDHCLSIKGSTSYSSRTKKNDLNKLKASNPNLGLPTKYLTGYPNYNL